MTNWKRYAVSAVIEFWNDGLAWSVELGPFCVMRTPPEKATP